jgi:[NiFe] hydrogenase diaphorase moiety small subunit
MAEAGRTFRLDGTELPFEAGDTVIEAAHRAGRSIPHLCWSEGLAPHGSCRLCTVLVNGQPQAACTGRLAPGAEVQSRTPELEARRRLLLQMLFVEGNHFCPGCEKSGACGLQSAAYREGLQGLGFETLAPQHAVDASHPDVYLDRNRCILCGLCVRASRDIDGKAVFLMGGAGLGVHLVVNSPSGRLGDTDLAVSDRAAHICPVGALLPKRRGFVVPIGQRPADRDPVTGAEP